MNDVRVAALDNCLLSSATLKVLLTPSNIIDVTWPHTQKKTNTDSVLVSLALGSGQLHFDNVSLTVSTCLSTNQLSLQQIFGSFPRKQM